MSARFNSLKGQVEVGRMATRTVTLSAGQELRIEGGAPVATVKLLSGTAEVFGKELPVGGSVAISSTAYVDVSCEFKDVSTHCKALRGHKAKTAIYSWHGASLEVTGPLTSEYVAGDTPMDAYLKVHLALEQQRESSNAPRVML